MSWRTKTLIQNIWIEVPTARGARMSDGAKQSRVTRDVGETDTLSGSFMEHYELKTLRGNEDQNSCVPTSHWFRQSEWFS